MNLIMGIVIGTFGISTAYFVCATFKHGLCDMGKMFNLLVLIGSLVTGIYLCIHAVELAIASLADGAWLGVPRTLLVWFSPQHATPMFRKLFPKTIPPTQLPPPHP